VSVGAVVACCALAAACSPDQAPASMPSPTPVATTPAESQIERQMRLDYEVAEEAYRAAVAEHDRQAQLGIASSAELRRTATDVYLDFTLRSLRRSRDAGWRATGETRIVDVVGSGWQQRTVRLIACEDSSGVLFTDKRGEEVTPRIRRTYVQDLTARKIGKDWKVADISSTVVKSFEGHPCAA
jgi:type II secretory pathway component HofQ